MLDRRDTTTFPHVPSFLCHVLISLKYLRAVALKWGGGGLVSRKQQTLSKCWKRALKQSVIFMQSMHRLVIILDVSVTRACPRPHSPGWAKQHSVNTLHAYCFHCDHQEEARKTVMVVS